MRVTYIILLHREKIFNFPVRVRVALAHSNGHVSLMSKRRRKKVLQLVEDRSGLSQERDRIMMTREFLKGEYELVEAVLTSLFDRYWELKNSHIAE